MTNYEWLDYKERLVEFINDLGGDCPMIRSEFCKKYGIPFESYAADYADEYEGADDNFAEVIVDWLEQEHPKYIDLKNVVDIITKAQEKFKGATVVQAYGEEIIRRLEQCEMRELEE